MKIKPSLLIMLAGPLILGACQPGTTPAAVAPTVTETPVPTTIPTVVTTPTKSLDLNDMKTELDNSVDDGGTADLKQLQAETKGL